MRRSTGELGWLGLWAVVIGVVIAASLFFAARAPLDVDEGYNLAVVQTLVRGGPYATTKLSETEVLNPDITTGPVVLLPVAVAVKALGESGFTARLVPLAFFFGLLAVIARRVRRDFGDPAAMAVVLLLGLSTFVAGLGGRVLGEASGLMFLLLGFEAAARGLETGRRRWWALTALAGALAVLCKFQYLLAVGPAVALGAAALLQRRRGAAWPTIALAGGLGAGVAAWLLVHVALVGPSGTVERLLAMRQFGDTVKAGGLVTWPLVATLMPVPLFLAVMGGALASLRWSWREPVWLGWISLMATWFAWFLVLDKQLFARHAYPGVVLAFALAVCGAAWAWRALGDRPAARLGRAALALAVAALIGSRAWRAVAEGRALDDSEARFVAYCRTALPEGAALFGWTYVVPWRIGFLTGLPVDGLPGYATLGACRHPYMVTTMEEQHWFRAFLDTRTEPVFAAGHYRLFTLKPGALTAPNSLSDPAACRGTLRPVLAATLPAGATVPLAVQAGNTGHVAWLGPTADEAGRVELAWRWRGATGVVEAPAPQGLMADVLPGGGATIAGRVEVPSTPGQWVLECELRPRGASPFVRSEVAVTVVPRVGARPSDDRSRSGT